MDKITTTEDNGYILSQRDIDMMNYATRCKLRCCANCEYWDIYENMQEDINYELVSAECHCHPPMVPNVFDSENWHKDEVNIVSLAVELIHGTPLMAHPFTFGSDWCGEFSAIRNPRIEEPIE